LPDILRDNAQSPPITARASAGPDLSGHGFACDLIDAE